MQAIVLADGDVASRERLDAAWPGWAEGTAFVVAADGGARHAGRLGLRVNLWIGDGDSTTAGQLAALEAAGVEVRRVPAAKDESDTELAVLAAVEAGADRLVVVGAFGGARIDHTLANVGLLALPGLVGRAAVLLDGNARVRLVRGPGEAGLTGRTGDLVSLLPLGPGVGGVTTDGLAFPLRDEPLPPGPARGLSNVLLGPKANVTVRSGTLLVIETPATLGQ
ncbi:MAG: thiamine diphosphokinase [Chloroflexota bacterium]